MTRPLNLLVLFPDQMRGDALGFMGNPVCRTPHFDRLAARSVTFTRLFTTFPKCVPARASFVTGRYPHSDGWRSVSQVLEPGQPNLLRSLQAAGYQSCVFGKNHCWHAEEWDRLDYTSYAAPLDVHLVGRRERKPIDFESPGLKPARLHEGWHYLGNGTRHLADEAFTDQAIDFLAHRRDPSRPFYLQLNWESPHTDYGVEEPWFSMYARDALPPLPCSLPENAPLALRAQREHRTGLEDDPAAAREVQATYYGMISKVDHLCGRVLELLDRLDLWRDTIVLFVSDHGDYAGQYGLPEKWDTHFADCLLHVPCTLAAPGLPAGTRVASLCDLASLAPTLCELLALPPLPGMQGESLLPLVAGERAIDAVFAHGGHEPEMRRRFVAAHRESIETGTMTRSKSAPYAHCPDSMARAQMVRTVRHKLVVRETGEHEFYDLAADPFERRNLWGSPCIAPHLPDLFEKLARWNVRTLPDRPYLEKFTV